MMIEWLKDRWHERSTKLAIAILILLWVAAIAASLLVPPDRWPQVKEALEWPIGLASSGALMAAMSNTSKGKKPPCKTE
jgi:hypothetical protein